jgi:hypothetical protein
MILLTLLAMAGARAGPELCNGVDDDGDGQVDEPPVLWHPDADGDGYGDRAGAIAAAHCGDVGLLADGSDCDDDVNDVHPGQTEACNGMDDDCDGQVDESGCGCDAEQDDDSVFQVCDTSRSWTSAQSACAGVGYNLVVLEDAVENAVVTGAIPGVAFWWIGLVDTGGDDWVWDDGTALDPAAASWASGEPNDTWHNCVYIRSDTGAWYNWDCNAQSPFVCEIACPEVTSFADADGDGLGDPAAAEASCWPAADRVFNALDCDDGDVNVGRVVYFLDEDGDGFGDDDPTLGTVDCEVPLGFAEAGGDCDDGAGGVYPGADEVCNGGIDDDCDGLADDADPTLDPATAGSWWLDGDGDGYGAGDEVRSCDPPASGVDRGGDCDDDDEAVSPGAVDVPGDGVDQDCDGEDGPRPPDTGTTSGPGGSGGTGTGGGSGSAGTGRGDRAPPPSVAGTVGSGQPGCGCGGGGPSGWLAMAMALPLARRRR